MATIDPATLKADVETALTDLQSVLNLVEELPEPAGVKNVIDTVQKVLADVKAFLDAPAS